MTDKAVLALALGAAAALAPSAPRATDCIDDVERQFAAIAETGRPLNLPASSAFAAFGPNAKGPQHLQGVQRLGDGRWVVTGSADADLFVVDRAGQSVRERADGAFAHAGGIQVLGPYVAVGVERGNRMDGESRVVFYDLTHPMAPRRLSNPIARQPGDLPQPCAAVRAPTAGAVALARLSGERMLLIVGRWDSDVLDFYLSSGDRLEEARFQRVDSWCTAEVRDAEGRTARFGRYQALNLLPACGGGWFLIGFETSDGRDLAALFRLELRLDDTDRRVRLVKLAERAFRCERGCGFAAGAGASVEDGRLTLVSVEPRTRGRTLRIYEFDPP